MEFLSRAHDSFASGALLDTFRLAWIYHDGISLLDEKTAVRGAVCESPGLAQGKTCRNNNLDPSRHPTVCARGLAGRLERGAHCRYEGRQGGRDHGCDCGDTRCAYNPLSRKIW